MAMGSLINLIPVFAFLVFLLGISVCIQRRSRDERKKDFAKD